MYAARRDAKPSETCSARSRSTCLPQRALVIQEDQNIALQIPLDKPGPRQVLIKNAAVTQNPADWKYLYAWKLLGAGQGLGSDFAGRIAALGEGVTDWKVGDRVAGSHPPLKATKIAQNAFCEYTITNAKPLLRIPDNITDEQAATIHLQRSPLCTVCTSLPTSQPAPLGGHALLVWGGSSSVGLYAIQLAHIAGYKVITTASPKNHALVKSQGADVAIDYRAPDVVEQIIAASGRGGIDFVYDAISEGESTALATKTLKRDGPKKVAIVLPVDVSNLDQSVEYHFAAPVTFWDYDIEFGGMYRPRNKAEFELGLDFFENATDWLKEGRFKPNPVTVRPGGLSGVQDGLEFMRAGKVSGTKLVYRIAETSA